MQSTCPVDSIGCPSPFEKSERREIGTKGHVSHHGLKVNNNMERDCLQINIIDWIKYLFVMASVMNLYVLDVWDVCGALVSIYTERGSMKSFEVRLFLKVMYYS